MVERRLLIIIQKNSVWLAHIKSFLNNIYKYDVVEFTEDANLELILLNHQHEYILIESSFENKTHILWAIKSLITPKCILVLASNGTFASDCYDIDNIIDYLDLPINKTRFLRAIQRLVFKKPLDSNKLGFTFRFFGVGRTQIRINFDDIQYIEAYGIYSKVYKNKTFTLIGESFHSLEIILPPNQFIRVHRSFIININNIESIDSNNLMVSGKQIPIGLKFKNNLNLYKNMYYSK